MSAKERPQGNADIRFSGSLRFFFRNSQTLPLDQRELQCAPFIGKGETSALSAGCFPLPSTFYV